MAKNQGSACAWLAMRHNHPASAASCRPRPRTQRQPPAVHSSSRGKGECASRRPVPAAAAAAVAMIVAIASLITPGVGAFEGARSQAALAAAMGVSGTSSSAEQAAAQAASNFTADGRYAALGPVADRSFRAQKQGGGLMWSVKSKMRSMAGNLTSIASTR